MGGNIFLGKAHHHIKAPFIKNTIQPQYSQNSQVRKHWWHWRASVEVLTHYWPNRDNVQCSQSHWKLPKTFSTKWIRYSRYSDFSRLDQKFTTIVARWRVCLIRCRLTFHKHSTWRNDKPHLRPNLRSQETQTNRF